MKNTANREPRPLRGATPEPDTARVAATDPGVLAAGSAGSAGSVDMAGSAGTVPKSSPADPAGPAGDRCGHAGTDSAPALREAAWYADRIACLSGFMTAERCELFRRTVSMRTRYMTVLAENMYHGQNAAALIRHCEAFGIQRMHTVETLCPFEPNASIARGTDRWVDVVRHPSTAEALAALKGEGYRIVATTPHREDRTPETFDVAAGPFVLVFGTEHAGISDEVMASADEFLRIPMCGMVESLNVSASAAILIYMLSERMRQTVPGWRMCETEREEVLFRWMATSVRDAAAILEKRFGPA